MSGRQISHQCIKFTRSESNHIHLCTTHGDLCPGYDKYGQNHNFKGGDIIDMILDLDKLQLSYKVNDTDLGVAFSKIEPTSYRACIDICSEDDSVQIIV